MTQFVIFLYKRQSKRAHGPSNGEKSPPSTSRVTPEEIKEQCAPVWRRRIFRRYPCLIDIKPLQQISLSKDSTWKEVATKLSLCTQLQLTPQNCRIKLFYEHSNYFSHSKKIYYRKLFSRQFVSCRNETRKPKWHQKLKARAIL